MYILLYVLMAIDVAIFVFMTQYFIAKSFIRSEESATRRCMTRGERKIVFPLALSTTVIGCASAILVFGLTGLTTSFVIFLIGVLFAVGVGGLISMMAGLVVISRRSRA